MTTTDFNASFMVNAKIVTIVLIISLITICMPRAGYTQMATGNSTLESKSTNQNKMENSPNSDFTATILVNQTPKEVFNAINNVRGWWSEEIVGNTSKLNDEFILQYEDMHRCKIKLVEVVPNRKVVWLVEENYFKFTKDSSEWTNNKMIFEITEKNNKTQLQFTQVGLVPEYECYDICSNAWVNYINNSLFNLIVTGKGQPNAKGKPQTEDERRLSTKQ
jgi:hypothetical protein